jgi:hypothetical protein
MPRSEWWFFTRHAWKAVSAHHDVRRFHAFNAF